MRSKGVRKGYLVAAFGLVGLASTPSLAEQKPPSPRQDFYTKLMEQAVDSLAGRAKAAAIVLDLWVDPKGRVFNCSAKSVAGSEKPSENFCRNSARLRMIAAKDAQGQAAFGRFTTMTKVFDEGANDTKEVQDATWPPDVEIILNRLPDGADRSYDLSVAVAVDDEGRVSECDGSPSIHETLETIVCSQVQNVNYGVMRSADGKPVPYIRAIRATFTADNES